MTGRAAPAPVRVRTPQAHRLEGIDPIVARVLAARGITAPETLDLALSRLAPIGLLGKVDAAADLLAAHRDRRVVVVGDFDADGATSTALMLRCLRAMASPTSTSWCRTASTTAMA